MAKIVRKLFGERPEHVHVLAEVAEFDKEGLAEVSDEAAQVFINCPGYELVESTEESTDNHKEEEKAAEDIESSEVVEEDTESSEATEEEDTEEEKAEVKTKRPAPARRTAPRR
jgi:hypothetical protein